MFHGKEYVYEVYKEKSFSRAAQNLYISQPALSAAIKKIVNTKIANPIYAFMPCLPLFWGRENRR